MNRFDLPTNASRMRGGFIAVAVIGLAAILWAWLSSPPPVPPSALPSSSASESEQAQPEVELLEAHSSDKEAPLARGDALAVTAPAIVDSPQSDPPVTVTSSTRISGTVVGPGGAPVSGARVRTANRKGQVAKSDSLGRFVLDALVEPPFGTRLRLIAEHEKASVTASTELDVEPGAPVEDVIIAFADCGTLRGRVLDAERRPVPRTPVFILGLEPERARTPSQETDDNGQFAFDLIGPGSYGVSALLMSPEENSKRGFLQTLWVEADVVSGGVTEIELLAFTPDGTSVSGVVTQGGLGVSDTALHFVRGGRLPENSVRGTRTDDTGSYEVVLEAGDYIPVLAFPEQDQTLLGQLHVGQVDALEANLRVPEGSLEGRLSGINGEGFGGQQVRAECISGTFVAGTDIRETMTSSDGRFALSHLHAGTWMVRVRSAPQGWADLVAGPFVLAADQVMSDLELQYSKACSVSVAVATGEAPEVSSVLPQLFVREAHTQTASRTGERCGSLPFEIQSLAPGTYQFLVIWNEYASEWSNPVPLSAGQTSHVKLALASAGSVLIRCAGAPAAVRVFDSGGNDVTSIRWEAPGGCCRARYRSRPAKPVRSPPAFTARSLKIGTEHCGPMGFA